MHKITITIQPAPSKTSINGTPTTNQFLSTVSISVQSCCAFVVPLIKNRTTWRSPSVCWFKINAGLGVLMHISAMHLFLIFIEIMSWFVLMIFVNI